VAISPTGDAGGGEIERCGVGLAAERVEEKRRPTGQDFSVVEEGCSDASCLMAQ
jgi:hypothetical protein